MRRFELHRAVDHTGVSGTGVVAQGVVFDDGTACLRWLSAHATTVIYTDIADVYAIHGHHGDTRIAYLDQPEGVAA